MKKFLPEKISSKGAVSIFIVMSVLAVVLAITLGSILVAIVEKRMSLNRSESVNAYYAAETGIEKAIYDVVKTKVEPAIGFRCAGTCNEGNAGCCAEGWSDPINGYCLSVVENIPCDYSTVVSVKSIGNYRTTRRSIEIAF